MVGILKVIHVFVCVFLVISILLQSSKGGGLAGMFGGGGGMGAVFGGRGAASFLSKATMWLGVCFALTSVSIALLSVKTSSKQKSLVQQVVEQEGSSSPAANLPTAHGTLEESVQEVPIEGEEADQ